MSWLLSRTVLKGEASAFTLELPPYRRPNVTRILYTSIIPKVGSFFISPFGIWISLSMTPLALGVELSTAVRARTMMSVTSSPVK